MGTVIILLIIFGGLIVVLAESSKQSKMSPEELASHLHGPLNPVMVCPHCTMTNCVHTKACTQKQGVSGAKAAGAVLTGGLSVLATGLSRKVATTEAYCHNCKSIWHF